MKPFGKISPWPNVFTGTDIIIYDTQMPPVLTDWDTVKGKLEELHAAGTYELIHTDQGIIVFRKN